MEATTNCFTELSLKRSRAKLLCPDGHGVKRVTSVADGLARLSCGCTRGETLPAKGVSLENLSRFAAKKDQALARRLFPAVWDDETTTQREWYEAA